MSFTRKCFATLVIMVTICAFTITPVLASQSKSIASQADLGESYATIYTKKSTTSKTLTLQITGVNTAVHTIEMREIGFDGKVIWEKADPYNGQAGEHTFHMSQLANKLQMRVINKNVLGNYFDRVGHCAVYD